MRRKTIAKRVLEHENEDEQEEEDQKHDIDDRKLQSKVLCHGLQKRRKPMYPTKERAEENSSAAGILKLKTRAFELDSPGVEQSVDGDSAPQEADCLQLRSKAELVAMVLCMQKEMESLKEQIRCLTACGKLARNLEALVERTQLWSDGDGRTPSPSNLSMLTGGGDLAPAVLASPAVLNGQWAKRDGPTPNGQPESHKGAQRNGQPVFQENTQTLASFPPRCMMSVATSFLTAVHQLSL